MHLHKNGDDDIYQDELRHHDEDDKVERRHDATHATIPRAVRGAGAVRVPQSILETWKDPHNSPNKDILLLLRHNRRQLISANRLILRCRMPEIVT